MYDLAVIGGGPGGYVAAIRGAQAGMNVLLVEKAALGGTCLNRGCIPTKTLIYDSKLFHQARTSPLLNGSDHLTIDPQKLIARKRKVVSGLVSGLNAIIKSNRIELAAGQGKVLGGGRLKVVAKDQSTTLYEAKNIVIATGSRPMVPGFIDVDGIRVQTTDQALDDDAIPAKVAIIGGGVIGIEMATLYLNLGAQVTIIELLPDILTGEDADIQKTTRRILKKRKAKIFLGAKAKEIVAMDKGASVSFEDKKGQLNTLEVDKVLVATGRAPVFDPDEAARLGITLEKGFVKVTPQLETNVAGIYAIGDAVGGMMLAHKASAEAEVAVEAMGGKKAMVKPRLIPRCIWGPAEIGSVGISQKEAEASGRRIKIGNFPYSASGAAQAMGHTDGFAKIIGDADNGEILGVHIMGEHATDLISEAVTAMKMEGAVEDLYEAIKPHPTVSETVLEAALDWNKIAIHLPKKR